MEDYAPTRTRTSDLAHLYRGELAHADAWRGRLDQTTNWALTTTAAALSVSFSNPEARHVFLLVGIWMVVSFLLIEARRYRYYDIWFRRVRLLEDGFWASELRGEPVDPDAVRELAGDLARPQIRLSLFSAIAVRLHLAYGPVLMVLFAGWYLKVYSHPVPATSFHEFLQHAHVGAVSGVVVFPLVVACTVLLMTLLIVAMFAPLPAGEIRVRPRARRLAIWQVVNRPYGKPQFRRKPNRIPGASGSPSQ